MCGRVIVGESPALIAVCLRANRSLAVWIAPSPKAQHLKKLKSNVRDVSELYKMGSRRVPFNSLSFVLIFGGTDFS